MMRQMHVTGASEFARVNSLKRPIIIILHAIELLKSCGFVFAHVQ